MSDIIQKLEMMAQEYEGIAQDARKHAEALKKILGGEIVQVSKPKRYVSPETRQKLKEKITASWAKRKKARIA